METSLYLWVDEWTSMTNPVGTFHKKSVQWELSLYLWLDEWTNMTNPVGTFHKYANTPNYIKM